MTPDYENLRHALIQATHRIIALEKQQAALEATQGHLIEACSHLVDRLDKLTDEFDVATGKPVRQMSPDEIRANACGGTTWSMLEPTLINLGERLVKRSAS